MKKIKSTNRFKAFFSINNSAGFTLIEVMASVVILSVGILGLASSVNSVRSYQDHAKNTTLATMHMTSKLEEIKRFAANEPTGGIFGFGYLVDDSVNGYLNGYTAPDDYTRSSSDTIGGFSREWELSVYPVAAQATENFVDPNLIHMVEAVVTISWVDKKGKTKNLEIGTVLHRRQFIN